MRGFGTLDVAVLIAYLVGVTAFGVLLAGRQRDARAYFLADRSMAWWAICFSVVATETSALTFISIPATAYASDFWILQLVGGYIIGRIGVAVLLLPAYFAGRLATAYELLEQRFGAPARRFASSIFMLTRALADSVRIFAASIPLALLTGWPYWQSIVLIGVLTLIYTYRGGLRAVIWVDVAQMLLYLLGGVVAVVVLGGVVSGGWPAILEAGAAAGKLRVVHLEGGFASARWLLTGLAGGAFLSLASHGADQLTVQRLLAARDLAGARRAVVWSGLLVALQFALFLVVGLGLWVHYGGASVATPDEVFPRFILESFPAGLAGLMVAGILAAAMSTVSSSLNSLASATTLDLYAPLAGRELDSEHLMRAGRGFTLLWAAVLIGGAILFQLAATGTPVVVVALQIASFTYGGLLGGFLLALLRPGLRPRRAIAAMAAAIVAMTGLWAAQQFGVLAPVLDPLWFSLAGSLVALAVGATGGRRWEASKQLAPPADRKLGHR